MALLLRGAGCSGMEPAGETEVAQHFGENLGSVPSQFLALNSALSFCSTCLRSWRCGWEEHGVFSIPHPRGELNPLLLLLH